MSYEHIEMKGNLLTSLYCTALSGDTNELLVY